MTTFPHDTRIHDLLAVPAEQYDLAWLQESLQVAVELELSTIGQFYDAICVALAQVDPPFTGNNQMQATIGENALTPVKSLADELYGRCAGAHHSGVAQTGLPDVTSRMPASGRSLAG